MSTRRLGISRYLCMENGQSLSVTSCLGIAPSNAHKIRLIERPKYDLKLGDHLKQALPCFFAFTDLSDLTVKPMTGTMPDLPSCFPFPVKQS